jgi:hypothetical protein
MSNPVELRAIFKKERKQHLAAQGEKPPRSSFTEKKTIAEIETSLHPRAPPVSGGVKTPAKRPANPCFRAAIGRFLEAWRGPVCPCSQGIKKRTPRQQADRASSAVIAAFL